MANQPLRGCPVCGTKVEDIAIGLRDFRWVAEALPGLEAPMDFDCVLEKNGRFLVLELKPEKVGMPLGQRITLRAAVRLGMDVWVVWQGKDGKHVEVGPMDKYGAVPFVQKMTVAQLRGKVVEWRRLAEEER